MSPRKKVKEPTNQELFDKVLSILKQIKKELGAGLTENIYENAICYELQKNGIQYTQQEIIIVKHNGICIGNLRADICIHKMKMVIELKAIDTLYDKNNWQILQQIKFLNFDCGILFNFNQKTNADDFQYVIFSKSQTNDTTINCINSVGKKITYNFEQND